MLVAVLSFPPLWTDGRGGVYVGRQGIDGRDGYPWQQAYPQEYRIENGVLHGTRQGGYVRLPAGADLMMLTPHGADVAGGRRVDVYQQDGVQFDVNADDWPYPGYLGSLSTYSDVLVMPGSHDGILWFGASEADWTADVSTPETRPLTSSLSGSGNAVVVYDGPALSGRFQHTGSGIFLVASVTVGDWDSLVNEVNDVDVRASWKPGGRIAFFVEADTGTGSWTITLDTPATDPPASDAPAPPPPSSAP